MNVCVSAVTSAVSHALAVTVCSVTPANLDSSSREAAVSKPAQKGEENAQILTDVLLSSPFTEAHHKLNRYPLSFSVTLAIQPPGFVIAVTPLAASVGVVETETVWVVGGATST